MAEYTRKYKRGRWVGTSDMFREAVGVAAKEVGSWTGQVPDFDLEAVMEGQEISSEDPADLETILGRKRDSVVSLSITVGEFFSSHVVELRLGGKAAVAFDVTGTDEDEVRGLAAHLTDLLEAGQRAPRSYSRGALALSAIFPALLLDIVLAGVFDKAEGDESTELPLWLITFYAGQAVLLVLVAWLTPNVELLGPNEVPRIRRFRAAAIAAAVAIVLGVVAAMIAEPIA